MRKRRISGDELGRRERSRKLALDGRKRHICPPSEQSTSTKLGASTGVVGKIWAVFLGFLRLLQPQYIKVIQLTLRHTKYLNSHHRHSLLCCRWRVNSPFTKAFAAGLY